MPITALMVQFQSTVLEETDSDFSDKQIYVFGPSLAGPTVRTTKQHVVSGIFELVFLGIH